MLLTLEGDLLEHVLSDLVKMGPEGLRSARLACRQLRRLVDGRVSSLELVVPGREEFDAWHWKKKDFLRAEGQQEDEHRSSAGTGWHLVPGHKSLLALQVGVDDCGFF